MDNAWRMINDLVSNLTGVITGILGLGVVGALAFGDVFGLRCNYNKNAWRGWLIGSHLNHHYSCLPKEVTLFRNSGWLSTNKFSYLNQ